MFSNTKLLVSVSLLTVISGFGFLWFGLSSKEQQIPAVSPLPEIIESSSSAKQTLGVMGEKVLVTKVVDGDTIIVNNTQTVRFIGMDTPETVDPKRPVGCFGKEASNETKSLLTNKTVILQKDVSETDKYKRLLRYVYLPLDNGQTLFVNDYLVREGFARVLTYPPDTKFDAQFKQAEMKAKQTNKGLWASCK